VRTIGPARWEPVDGHPDRAARRHRRPRRGHEGSGFPRRSPARAVAAAATRRRNGKHHQRRAPLALRAPPRRHRSRRLVRPTSSSCPETPSRLVGAGRAPTADAQRIETNSRANPSSPQRILHPICTLKASKGPTLGGRWEIKDHGRHGPRGARLLLRLRFTMVGVIEHASYVRRTPEDDRERRGFVQRTRRPGDVAD